MLSINGVNYLLIEGSKVLNTSEMKEVPVHKVSDGSHFFLARGEEGMEKISLGLFIMNTNETFKLPLAEWGKVSVGYLDDDTDNLEAGNLYPIYPEGGIPYPHKEGFYYIPQFEMNVINKLGLVYRLGRESYYPGPGQKDVISGGYPIAKLDGVKGDERRYKHRLLAVTFNNPPKHYPKLQVDHDDGDKYNYRLDNLIWVTQKENIEKALYQQGLRTDNQPLDVFDLETGMTVSYVAKAEFARVMEVDPWVVSLVMKRERSVYKERYILKDREDARTFKEILDTPRLSIKTVKARNVFTGEVCDYPSLAVASRKTGVTTGSIRTAITGGNPRSVFNDLQFKMGTDELPWDELNEFELECVRRGMRCDASAYELTDVETNHTQVVYGNDGVASLTGADPRTVMQSAKYGKLLLKKYVLKKLTR